METLIISGRYCGPPKSGNGGYVSGRIARHIAGAATVRLHAPPPLETGLQLEAADGVVRLLHESQRVAEGRAATLELAPPLKPSFADALEASKSYLGHTRHSFPGCFVCGTHREPGDGLRIFAGPLAGGPVVASPWIVHPSLAENARIPDEFLWAALDCPGAFAVLPVAEGRTILLGEMSARIDGAVQPGERCVAIGWPIEVSGRKRLVGSAVFSETGETVAVGRATWIEVDETAFAAPGPA